MLRSSKLLLILFTAIFYQCSSSGTGPTPPPSSTDLVLSKVSGDFSSGVVGNVLTAQLVVLLQDNAGNPVSGRQIDFAVTQGNATLSTSSSATGSDGRASTTLTWGQEVGTVDIGARVSGTNISTQFQVSATSAPVALIAIISGNNQIGESATLLKKPIVVEARDANGSPVANAILRYSTANNEVAFTEEIVRTDANGRAENTVFIRSIFGDIRITIVTGIVISPITAEVNLFALGNERIVYSAVLPNSGIFIMNPDGSGQINIAESAFEPNSPAWSPDGSKIVFRSFNTENQAHDLYTINFDGTEETLIFNSQLRLFDPSWSPSGELIVFSLENQDGQDRHLYTINADGTSLRQLTNARNTRDSAPSWSSDSEKVIFERDADIYTINIDGTELTPLIEGEDLYFNPSWSSDGSRILYSRFSTNTLVWNIHVMNADGSNDVSLTSGQGLVLFPAWSPDDSQIIYTCFSDLYIMNADGGNKTKITDTFHDEAAPKWGRKR